jgi:hypothetical protein
MTLTHVLRRRKNSRTREALCGKDLPETSLAMVAADALRSARIDPEGFCRPCMRALAARKVRA